MVTSEPPSEKAGGAEKICWELSSILKERGHDVRILTSWEKDGVQLTLDKKNNKMARKLLFDYYNLYNNKIIRIIIDEFDPDIVHFHNVYGIGSSLIRTTSNLRPTVATIHDYWPFCFRSTMMVGGHPCSMNCVGCRFPLATITRSIKKNHLNRIRLIAPSGHMKTTLNKAGFYDVDLIYNGIRDPSCSTDHTAWNRLIFSGRLIEEKGIKVLIAAMNGFDERLDIFGDGVLRGEVDEAFHDRLNVTIHGYDPNPDYWRGGVVVLPSIMADNLPTTLLEALAYGLPIIASDIGGIPEIVKNGFNGFLIHPGNAEALTDCARKLLDQSLYKRMADNSREIMKSRFTWKECADKHERTYRDVIERFNHT